MEVLENSKKQPKQEYSGIAICKKCGAKLSYTDDDVDIIERGNIGFYTSGLVCVGNRYEDYITCPCCGNKIKVVSRTSKKHLSVFVAICIVIILILILSIPMVDCTYKSEHKAGIYSCPNCHSYDTSGFNTFWYNDGMLCNGSKEYNMEHADYTIMSCDNCGKYFRLYRSDWK